MYDEALVSAALAALEERLEKSSKEDLDNPEGADLDAGTHAGEKLSDHAEEDEGASGAAKKSPKPVKKGQDGADKTGEQQNPDEDTEMGTEVKSLNARADAEIKNKIEVSDFLKSLHEGLNDTLEAMGDVIAKSATVYDGRTKSMEEKLDDVMQYQAKLGVVLKAMCEHLGMLGNQPARGPKAVSTAVTKSGAGTPVERQFADPRAALAAAADKSELFPGLSDNPVVAKAQLVGVALDLAKSGKIEPTDVINLEMNGHIRPEIVPMIQKAFAAQAVV